MRTMLVFFMCMLSLNSVARQKQKKGKKPYSVFSSWGYNRAFFTRSAIHFTGEEYDFTLKHTLAKDRQSPLSAKNYLDLTNMTIPQYNFCIGMTLPHQLSVTIGQDHMKYVVQNYSIATLDGYTHTHDEFEGDYHNQQIVVTPEFLRFEHTDGLNYVHATLNKEKLLLEGKKHQSSLIAIAGIHAGVLIPRSDVTLMHYNRNDKFHLAGYGLGINGGLRGSFLKYCFLRLDYKAGFIRMPDILVRGIEYPDRASQQFGFLEFFYSFGLQYAF